MSTLAVIAKAPVPGRVKTRLTPPLSPAQAAALAEAALRDTLDAMSQTPADRRVIVLDGAPGAWLPCRFDVVAQRGGDLAERLSAAFADLGGPTFLVGMDTPQVTPALLEEGLSALDATDAAFGPASDGGYWGIGLRASEPSIFRGVPMSVAETGTEQRLRLDAAGLTTTVLPELRDVDELRDACAVRELAPHGRFAQALDACLVAPGSATP